MNSRPGRSVALAAQVAQGVAVRDPRLRQIVETTPEVDEERS
ncbi:hypothetical protein [Nonomuraea marmarensis]